MVGILDLLAKNLQILHHVVEHVIVGLEDLLTYVLQE